MHNFCKVTKLHIKHGIPESRVPNKKTSFTGYKNESNLDVSSNLRGWSGQLDIIKFLIMNPLALQDVDNEMLRDADDYLRKHKILELFEVSLD